MNDIERREIEATRANLTDQYQALVAASAPRTTRRREPEAARELSRLRAAIALLDGRLARATKDQLFEGLSDDDLREELAAAEERLEDARIERDAIDGRQQPARRARHEREYREAWEAHQAVKEQVALRRQDALLADKLEERAATTARTQYERELKQERARLAAYQATFAAGRGDSEDARLMNATAQRLLRLENRDEAMPGYLDAARDEVMADHETMVMKIAVDRAAEGRNPVTGA